jgi:hypothetical protein
LFHVFTTKEETLISLHQELPVFEARALVAGFDFEKL